MNRNAEAITIFCSHLCAPEGVRPLEPREWSMLAERLLQQDLRPEYLLDFERQDFIDRIRASDEEADRYVRLIERSGSLRFELSKYEDSGIQILTRADADYPKTLKKKLGNACPPLFYYAGDPALLDRETVGYVGSRAIELSDLEFTKRTVAKTVARGYAVVTGGAKGIDSISAAAALEEGSAVIEYLSDSMLRKMRDSDLVREIRNGRVLLLSPVVPTAGFNVGIAMMRNRYIYAQSSGTVVIRSDKGKGGTWAGAAENLRKPLCPTFCRDCEYPGNQELIRLGAIPISEEWDGRVADAVLRAADPQQQERQENGTQLSLFDA